MALLLSTATKPTHNAYQDTSLKAEGHFHYPEQFTGAIRVKCISLDFLPARSVAILSQSTENKFLSFYLRKQTFRVNTSSVTVTVPPEQVKWNVVI